MRCLNKKGSHVGMVLSFAIFITFVFFLYILFEPSLKSSGEKKILLDNLEIKLLNYLEEQFMEITLYNKSAIGEDICIEDYISNFGIPPSFNITIKNTKNELVEYNVSGKKLLFIYSQNSSRIKIYGSGRISENFSSINCRFFSNLEAVQNLIGKDINSNKYVSEEKIKEAISEYEDDYNSFRKDKLGFRYDFNFDFIFKNSSGMLTHVESQFQALKRDVHTREIPIIYFNKDAELKSGGIILRIW